MFGKKEGKGEGTVPKETLINQIEQLAPGQEVGYCLLSRYGDKVYFVRLNPEYPDKGRKYAMSVQNLVDGKLTGDKTIGWGSDKPKDIASWILSNFVEGTGVPKKWEG